MDGEPEYTYHDVVQKPICPSYEEILERMKYTSLKKTAITITHHELFKWDDEEKEKEKAFEEEEEQRLKLQGNNVEEEAEEDNKWSQDLADALPGLD